MFLSKLLVFARVLYISISFRMEEVKTRTRRGQSKLRRGELVKGTTKYCRMGEIANL